MKCKVATVSQVMFKTALVNKKQLTWYLLYLVCMESVCFNLKCNKKKKTTGFIDDSNRVNSSLKQMLSNTEQKIISIISRVRE